MNPPNIGKEKIEDITKKIEDDIEEKKKKEIESEKINKKSFFKLDFFDIFIVIIIFILLSVPDIKEKINGKFKISDRNYLIGKIMASASGYLVYKSVTYKMK